jgi:cytoskeleton protein RodZ
VKTGVGATLRDARKRRRVDLDAVEDEIKIRVRYLTAMENEDWDVLPGGAYTRGFIRTYAGFLGLDGERLAAEYARGTSDAGERVPRRPEPVVAGPSPSRTRRIGARALTVLVPLALIALLLAIGLAGDDGDDAAPGPGATPMRSEEVGRGERLTVAARPGVSLGLAATGEVWVCLLDSDEAALLDGEILAAGARAGPFRASGFTVAFGNGEVELTVDGRRVRAPSSSSPVGYAIDEDGGVKPLEEGERPDCA